ncbi:hypothetical protein FACS1894199_06050 [Bacteroidia bacterium]|nr:hypothetical protein FACS1894199_06050 [Bacteroidia bacterium]
MEKINIGLLIKQKVREKSMTNMTLAAKLNCSRSAVNYLYRQKSIDVDRLRQISQILEYDFISEIYCIETKKKKLAENVDVKRHIIELVNTL